MSATINCTPKRKQLSDQLDRLDGIIDALADGLNQAVVDAAREGARAAVKEILLEVLTDPSILAIVRGSVATGGVPEGLPASPSRLVTAVRAVASAASAAGRAVRFTVRKASCRLRTAVAVARGTLGEAKRSVVTVAGGPTVQRIAAVSLGIGVVAVVTAMANHTVATVLCGLAASVAAAAVQVGVWVRSSVRRLGLICST